MPAETRPENGAERRGAPRVAASGAVQLTPENAGERVIDGHLIDLSSSGFRAQHGSRLLDSGETVVYAFAGRSGRARVVWTRIVAEHVESGFLLLPPEDN
jgi:hypothetical protein